MSLFRPAVEQTPPYLPGEQPQNSGWVKLNTNENPYPTSPKVAEAITAAIPRLHVYPDPIGVKFCAAVGELFGLTGDWVIPANGSDECLTMLLRSFVDADDLVLSPYPSYILYETLAGVQGGRYERLPLKADWSFDFDAIAEKVARAKLVFVPNPNSPSGNRWSDEELLRLLPPNGILVVDEAYGDFCDIPHRMELLKRPEGNRIVVTRTLSKSYSLAGLRLGFAIAHPEIIAGMKKVKESYNCDALALAGGEAAIRDQAVMLANRDRILATRARLTERLRASGFDVIDSQTNFVWTTHPSRKHREIYEHLKAHKVLIRYMRFPGAISGAEGDAAFVDGLRISIGTDAEIDRFLEVLATAPLS